MSSAMTQTQAQIPAMQAIPDYAPLTLTQAAAAHVQKHLGRRGRGIGLRVGVKTSGCSGLAYKVEYADALQPDDVVFEYFGTKLIVDQKSWVFLAGTCVDYEKEGLQEGLKFKNPKEKDTCGCGESFRV